MKVLKFSATWCGPCKQLAAILKDDTFKNIVVEEIDVDKNPDTAAKMGIRSVPTLVLVDDAGVTIDRVIGALGKNQLKEFFDKHDGKK